MKRFSLMLVVGAFIASSAMAAPSYVAGMSWSRGTAGSTWQKWTFDGTANPAAPENSGNPYGTPLAYLAGDNLGHWDAYDSHSGVWHAGSPRDDLLHITLDIPNNPDLNAAKEVWMEVVYRVGLENVGIAPLFDAVTPPGVTVTLLDSSTVPENPGSPTTWWTSVFHWSITPNPAGELVCIDISGTGGTVDSIAVDTLCGTIPAPGAMVLAGLGTAVVGWMRRRKTL